MTGFDLEVDWRKLDSWPSFGRRKFNDDGGVECQRILITRNDASSSCQ